MLIRFHAQAAIAAVFLVYLGMAAPAQAQIYTWRDGNGNLVLSSRPQAGTTPLRVYAVPKTTAIRATRSVAAARSRLYDDLLVEHARRNDVRVDLVRAVVQVESAYNPLAHSSKGAMGLMQLMPATAQEFSVSNPYDPEDNVRAGVAYLRQLLDRYQNDEQLALAAYNAGPGAVDKHGQNIPPYRETQNYVAQINQIAKGPVQPRDHRIYKVTDLVDGRLVVRYTDQKPSSGPYQLVVGR